MYVRHDGPIQITVRVLDVNDNDPMFESVFYMFSVAENTTAPLNVGTVTATDRDQGVCVCVCVCVCDGLSFSGLNGAFNYSIQPPLTSAPYPFSIDPFTGAITTTTELDRESIDRYNLTVVATDGTGRSGQTMVCVNVCVCVCGGGGGVWMGDLQCVYVGSNSVTSLSPVFLDWCTVDHLYIPCTCVCVCVQVVIMVDDVNDCDPTFTSSVYSVPVAENTPTGTRVTMVTARDCDLGSNGLIRYTIVGGNVGVFSLDGEGLRSDRIDVP